MLALNYKNKTYLSEQDQNEFRLFQQQINEFIKHYGSYYIKKFQNNLMNIKNTWFQQYNFNNILQEIEKFMKQNRNLPQDDQNELNMLVLMPKLLQPNHIKEWIHKFMIEKHYYTKNQLKRIQKKMKEYKLQNQNLSNLAKNDKNKFIDFEELIDKLINQNIKIHPSSM